MYMCHFDLFVVQVDDKPSLVTDMQTNAIKKHHNDNNGIELSDSGRSKRPMCVSI